MGKKTGPLEVLRKGLAVLENQIKVKHSKLTALVSTGKSISSDDEEWLDNSGNTVDEVYAINTLENASDYERGYNGLEDKYKATVLRLRELAGDLIKVVDKKRKSL
jgi:hypothetical protein